MFPRSPMTLSLVKRPWCHTKMFCTPTESVADIVGFNNDMSDLKIGSTSPSLTVIL